MSKSRPKKVLSVIAPPADVASNDVAYAEWLHSHAPQLLTQLFEDIAQLSVEERVKYNMQLFNLITAHKPVARRPTDTDTLAKLEQLLK